MRMSNTAHRGGCAAVLPIFGRRHAIAIGLAAALCAPAGHALATEPASPADFDEAAMRARGLDPALASYFREAPRFIAGERRVGLVINGQSRGTVTARFDAGGRLCFDTPFLQAAGLRTPASQHQQEADRYDFMGAWTQAVLRLDPANDRVELVVPEASLDERLGETRHYSTGGMAALVNYSVNSSVLRTGHDTQRYTSANLELGVNAGDWIVRSRQALNVDETGLHVQQLETYAQRSSTRLQKVMQLGEINVSSPLFGGAPIVGVQVVPENALREQDSSAALVEGNASSEARVEIRQSGMLLHSTVVPPGPFIISGFQVLNLNLDLEVTVHEGAATRSFIVPASSFRRASLSVPGTTFAAGRIRGLERGALNDDAVLVAASTAWRARRADAVFSTGILATPHYQSLAVGLDAALPAAATLSARALWSVDAASGAHGGLFEARVSAPVADRLNLNVTASHRTAGYRDLHGSGRAASDQWNSARPEQQWSAGLSWSTGALGSFTASYSPRRTVDGHDSNRVRLAWSKQFARANVALNMDRDISNSADGSRAERSAYLNISVPLGPTSVSATVRTRPDSAYVGVGVDHRGAHGIGYRLSAERDLHSTQQSLQAAISAVPRYAQVSLGYSQTGQSRSLSGWASGGLVAHRHGFTLSPYPLRETFGVVKIGEGAGTRISTPGGTVWTDFRGQAVIPDITAFGTSRIAVETHSMPRRYELTNGVQTLEASRGSVSRIEFGVTTTRRILAYIVDQDGQPVAKGTSVTADGQFITAVGDRGAAFLTNYEPQQELTLGLPDGTQCRLSVEIPDEQDKDLFYENAVAVCRTH